MLTNSKSLADHAGEIVGLAHAHKFLAICVYDPIGVVRWIFREHDAPAEPIDPFLPAGADNPQALRP